MNELTDLEQARRIAVALEQELARLREAAGTLAGRWDEHAATLTGLSAGRDAQLPAETARAGRIRGYTTAARDLRWVLANLSIPHDLMTSEELGEEDPS